MGANRQRSAVDAHAPQRNAGRGLRGAFLRGGDASDRWEAAPREAETPQNAGGERSESRT